MPVAILDQHLESVSSVINKETQATELVEPLLDATNFELSFEGLLSVNPSVLIIMQAEREKGLSTIDQWQAETIWTQLQAVSDERVFFVDRDTWSRARGLLALNEMLGDVSSVVDQLLDN